MYGGTGSSFSSVTLTVKGKVGSGEGGIISCAAAGSTASARAARVIAISRIVFRFQM
jgi:hypothetical protein